MRKYDLVCFDMDGTLTKLRSSWCWVHEHYGVDNEPAYQAFVNGEIDEPEFMRRDIALWKGVDPDVTVNDIALTFRDMPLIEGIQETIACLNDCHIRAVIVSGGIDLAAAMLTREFGFDDYVADELCAYEDGRLTGEGKMNVDLRDKGINVRHFIEKYGTSKERTVSIGNSFTDIGMFKRPRTTRCSPTTSPTSWTTSSSTISDSRLITRARVTGPSVRPDPPALCRWSRRSP